MKTVAELKALQRRMAEMLFRPLDADWRMQKKTGGRPTAELAAEIITPNDRLTSFERLEIYNRQYWFRTLDCLHDDYPGLRALVGERRFTKLCTAYLVKYPSASYTLRDLGSRLEQFLREEPARTGARHAMAVDMARFEWAQTVAFDGPCEPVVSVDDLLDTLPDRLRMGVQPYISLLDLDFSVDKFLRAVRKREGDSLRGEASNAMSDAPQKKKIVRRVPPPRREKVHLVVHRHDNALYYKRLDASAFCLLASLRSGRTLEAACASALELDPAVASKIQGWFSDWSRLGWFCRPPKKSRK
ncbi:MAG: HvfC/BufC family peptide modification chaperone [Chthoniobacterales bacterium]